MFNLAFDWHIDYNEIPVNSVFGWFDLDDVSKCLIRRFICKHSPSITLLRVFLVDQSFVDIFFYSSRSCSCVTVSEWSEVHFSNHWTLSKSSLELKFIWVYFCWSLKFCCLCVWICVFPWDVYWFLAELFCLNQVRLVQSGNEEEKPNLSVG